jgi:hypothetical protein
MTTKHILAAILGAIGIFFWGFVSHMLTPLGEAGMAPLPGVAAVSESLTTALGAKSGMYMFPTGGLTADSPKEMHAAAMEKIMEEMKTQPSGLLVYKPAGATFNFPKSLAIEFATNLLEALVVVYLLTQAAIGSFGGRVGFVFVAGILAAVATNVSYWNWFGFSGVYTAGAMTIEIIGFLVAGVVIAFVLKNTPGRV